MKYLLILLILSSHTLRGQELYPKNSKIPVANILCWYKLTFVADSINRVEKTEYMRLYCANNFSRFISDGAYRFDSLVTIADAQGVGAINEDFDNKLVQIVTNHRTRFNFDIYKSQSNIIYYERLLTSLFFYQERLPANWVISPSKMEINGYACQLATTAYAGRKYEAWFTRAIPLAEGPYKFSGLPGLIIKVYDTRKQYQFELSKLDHLKVGMPIILPNRLAKQTTKQQLSKAKQDMKLNLPNIIASATQGLTDDAKRTIRDKSKRDNNAIELR
ncbi:MAG: GLPGLI family protein [Hymenobacter sp.]|nr:MAG: GLPGLI family protein [Hymenobacter sp.]